MRNLKQSLKVVDYGDDVCIMNNMETTTTLTRVIAGHYTTPQGHTVRRSQGEWFLTYPGYVNPDDVFDTLAEARTAIAEDMTTTEGTTTMKTYTITTDFTAAISMPWTFNTTLAADRREAKRQEMKAKMANYYNLSAVLARGDLAGRA